jgi:hypothetical protein
MLSPMYQCFVASVVLPLSCSGAFFGGFLLVLSCVMVVLLIVFHFFLSRTL